MGKDIEYVGKTLLNKTPLELTSNPRVNLKGEREKNADYGNFGKWLLNFANQTILPAGVKLNTKSDVDIEIMRLFEATLDESIVPTKPSRKIQVYGKKYTMSNDEYTQYQETVGTAVYSCLTQLVNSAEYSRMNDAQRAEAKCPISAPAELG